MFFSVFAHLPYLGVLHESHFPMGWMRLEVTAGGPQVKLVAQFRANSKRNSGCSGQCSAVSWASPKNASLGMKLSLSQGCTTHPVDIFPHLCPVSICLAANLSCCFLTFPWAPWRFWLNLIYNQTSGSERQQPSFFVCCVSQFRQDLTTLVSDANCPHR